MDNPEQNTREQAEPRVAVLWHEGQEHPGFAPLAGAREADVVVVGAGIVGLVTAWQLQRAGLEVVVLDAHRVGHQATGASTAKLTALHGLIHSDLAHRFGDDRARLYAEANQWAIGFVEGLVEPLGDFGFRKTAAYTYATSPRQAAAVEREAQTLVRYGLPAEVVKETELPFQVLAAVKLADQAEIHPVRLLLALADRLAADRVSVHEQSRVVAVDDGQPCRVRTMDGATVTAAHVVLACHLPFTLRGGFFAKVTPRRRVAVSALVEGDRLDGMYKSAGDPSRSVRGATEADGSARIVAIGESFEQGTGEEAAYFTGLEDWIGRHFKVRAMTHRWGNMDYESPDGVPYVGRLHRLSGHLWTATGFGAWGLTNGVAAGRMISDAIIGKRNPWLGLFDATRLTQKGGLGEMLKRNLHVGQMWAGRLKPAPADEGAVLDPGEGAVLRRGGRKVALARDGDGTLHAVSAICPHMGCVLAWNAVERSWDCPCHGSRFDIQGRLLHGPAVKDLEQIALDDEGKSEKPDSP